MLEGGEGILVRSLFSTPLRFTPILYAEEVVKALKLLHEEHGHCNRDELIRAVRARFSVVGLEDHCRAVVTFCVVRSDNLIGFRSEGPMIHYSEQKTKVQQELLKQPIGCPDTMYNIMKNCWNIQSKQRPSAHDIIEELLHVANNCSFKFPSYVASSASLG